MLRRVLTALTCAALVGCGAMLPFETSVTPIIDDALRTKDADATGYAINDAGEVAGIYARLGQRPRVFVFSRGRLSLYENPCDGVFHIRAFTNTRMIGGTCTQNRDRREHRILVVKVESEGVLIEVAPAWPVEGYTLQGLNDRMDLIGVNDQPYHRKEKGIVGFAYISGKLRMLQETDFAHGSHLWRSALNERGVVVGGQRDPFTAKRGGPDVAPFVLENDRISTLRLDKPATVVSMNDRGEVLFQVEGSKFGLLGEDYKEIGCGKEWCKVFGINNLGWVIGHGHNTYPVPPMGASIGHTFLWANEQLFNLDKSVRRGIDVGQPVRLSDSGHILFHSKRWPYLLTPIEQARDVPR